MIQSDVIELHQEFFRDFGFEYDSAEKLFYKSFPQGNQVIYLNFSEYSDINYLEYSLGIRIHQVEQLIHEFLPTVMDYADKSITLIQTPDKISKKLPPRYIIETEAQVQEAMEKAENFFKTLGFPWLDTMIDPFNLEKEFTARKDKPFQSQNFVYNAFRSVALSRFYSSDDYPVLRQFYLEKIKEKDMTPFSIAAFLKFLDYLDKVPA
ncbi:MAG: hypothetical protein PSV36_12155 [Algoriphagus sp.]|nr:hypothetical protein [Algoriphagus sp.]